MKKKSATKPSLVQVIINALDDLKAQNIVTMDVSALTDVTDTLVIASGSSNRQVRALAQHAVDEAKKQGMPSMGIEGLDDGEWVLADFGDAVLHVMQPEVREFYDLEKLWHSPNNKIDLTEKSATAKASNNKTAKPKAAAGKTSTASETDYVTQSDAAKARKSPKKPKAVTTVKKAATGKVAPPKAGVLAKTGTRKSASSKAAPAKNSTKKPTTAKPAVSTKPTTSKPVAKSAAAKPVAKKPVAQKPIAKKPVTTKPAAKKTTATAKKPTSRKPG